MQTFGMNLSSLSCELWPCLWAASHSATETCPSPYGDCRGACRSSPPCAVAALEVLRRLAGGTSFPPIEPKGGQRQFPDGGRDGPQGPGRLGHRAIRHKGLHRAVEGVDQAGRWSAAVVLATRVWGSRNGLAIAALLAWSVLGWMGLEFICVSLVFLIFIAFSRPSNQCFLGYFLVLMDQQKFSGIDGTGLGLIRHHQRLGK